MKDAVIGMLVLLILQGLWLQLSDAADDSGSNIHEERSKQEKIYRSEGEKELESYVVNRSLSNYIDALPSGFDRALANLSPNDRWLDVGAGMGHAILDYYNPSYDQTRMQGRERRGKKAQAVAISIEDRRSAIWHQKAESLEPNQIQYFSNRRLREYSSKELGQFQLITDVIGGFSYSENISTFMEKILELLALNASFFTLLQDVSSEEGTNRPFYSGAPFLTQIADADGSEVKICSWLKSITCAEVMCELRTSWKPPIEVYSVRKVCNDVAVPALVPLHYAAGTPPERRFLLKK